MSAEYEQAMLAIHGPTGICLHCDMRIAKRSIFGTERLVWVHVGYGNQVECPDSNYATPKASA